MLHLPHSNRLAEQPHQYGQSVGLHLSLQELQKELEQSWNLGKVELWRVGVWRGIFYHCREVSYKEGVPVVFSETQPGGGGRGLGRDH